MIIGTAAAPDGDRVGIARAVCHPAAPGTARRWTSTGRTHEPVVVAGGGIAGIAAAVGLAERGVPVIMVEPHDQLGGRVRSWPVSHGADQVTMSRGFHAFFRQYYNLRALLRRVDPDLQSLVPVPDYPLILAEGHSDSFARIPRTPPLNLAAFVLQSPSFGVRDLAAVNVPAALELLDVDFPTTFSRYDGESAADFLDRLHFPGGARHLALEVFARSFFAHPDDFSAGELVAMFHTYFLGSSEGLLFDVPRDDYDSCLWAPLRRYLEELRVEVRTGEAVTSVDASQELPRVVLKSGDRDRGRGGRRCDRSCDDAPARPRVRDTGRGVAGSGRGDANCSSVCSVAAVAGSACGCRSARLPWYEWLWPARQCLGPGALRGGRPALVCRQRWVSCRAARVRAG